MASGVDTVLRVLEGADFQRLPKPLMVDRARFEFDAAVAGTGVSHDLVVVSGPSARPARLLQLLSGLSRTLDRLQSRRPVSLVIVGQRPDRSTLAPLERHARVLVVEHEAPTVEQIERAIAVLLPLELPETADAAIAPLAEVASMLGSEYSSEHEALIDAARLGPDAVSESLRLYVDGVIEDEESEGA